VLPILRNLHPWIQTLDCLKRLNWKKGDSQWEEASGCLRVEIQTEGSERHGDPETEPSAHFLQLNQPQMKPIFACHVYLAHST
jgi:hypothetical protein